MTRPTDGSRYREQRSSLEYLRSVAELRERGLHVSLRAYESRVFWELRELHDPAGVWRRLAERLGGAGVPSLEDALRDQQLAPVHDALRAVIATPSRETVARLVDVVATATGTEGDRAAVVESIAERAARAEPVIAAISDPSQEAALRLWTLLAPLGSLASGAPLGPTSRAWYEELRLPAIVAEGLRGRDLDEGAAWWAAERVRTLLDLPLPSTLGGPSTTLPSRLVEAWLAHPAVRAFLRVNSWDGVDWFHGESWQELLAWMDRLERVLMPREERARRPVELSVLERTLLDAAAASGYRVDGLRDALAGRAPAAGMPGSGAPRLPKATALPPGPKAAGSPTTTGRASGSGPAKAVSKPKPKKDKGAPG